VCAAVLSLVSKAVGQPDARRRGVLIPGQEG
jgi:hypothetical protein